MSLCPLDCAEGLDFENSMGGSLKEGAGYREGNDRHFSPPIHLPHLSDWLYLTLVPTTQLFYILFYKSYCQSLRVRVDFNIKCAFLTAREKSGH